jgi:hypothetical protein
MLHKPPRFQFQAYSSLCRFWLLETVLFVIMPHVLLSLCLSFCYYANLVDHVLGTGCGKLMTYYFGSASPTYLFCIIDCDAQQPLSWCCYDMQQGRSIRCFRSRSTVVIRSKLPHWSYWHSNYIGDKKICSFDDFYYYWVCDTLSFARV